MAYLTGRVCSPNTDKLISRVLIVSAARRDYHHREGHAPDRLAQPAERRRVREETQMVNLFKGKKAGCVTAPTYVAAQHGSIGLTQTAALEYAVRNFASRPSAPAPFTRHCFRGNALCGRFQP